MIKWNRDNGFQVDTSQASAPGVLRGLMVLVCLAVFGLVFYYASTNIYELFTARLGASATEANLAVVSSVGIVFGTLMITLTIEKHSVKGLAGLYLFIWVLLTLTLVALAAAVKGGLLAVPESLAAIGRVVAALLAAIALVPAISIPIVMRHPDHYPSAAAAIGGYIGFAAKGVAIAASVFASAFFGLSRGMPVEVAVLCGFVIESCFLWSYFSLIKARQNRDGFDIFLWALATVAFGCFIALISMETISTLAHIDVPLLRPFRDSGATLFASAVGLAVALTVLVHVLTSLINIPLDGSPRTVDGNARPLSRRMADGIIGARRGFAEVRGSFSDQLPEGQRSTVMAKDAPMQISEAEFIDAGERAGILTRQQAAILRANVAREDKAEDPKA